MTMISYDLLTIMCNMRQDPVDPVALMFAKVCMFECNVNAKALRLTPPTHAHIPKKYIHIHTETF